jgi:hypothetical protein
VVALTDRLLRPRSLPQGGGAAVWRSHWLLTQDDGMDEATWRQAADLYNVPASERPMLLDLAQTRIDLHPEQARHLNGNPFALAAVLVAQQGQPRTSR